MKTVLLSCLLVLALVLSACQSHTITQERQEPNVKSFTIQAENFAFYMNGEENPDIVVNQGDTVRINFVNNQGFHDWVNDEFKARTPQISANQTASVEFIASEAGNFEYYCSVGNHREMGMHGNILVQ